MPSIAGHMVIAKLVSEILCINDKDFIKGNLLPDVILNKESHHKIKGTYFLVPDLDYFKNNLDLNNKLELGYYTHLLLDYYFLEEYVPKVIKDLTVFETGIIYKEYENVIIKKPEELIPSKVIITTGAITAGFEAYDLNLLVVSSEDFFASVPAKKRKVNKDFSNGEKVVFADLKIGDYVVHQVHGIGQFLGVNTINANNTIKDYVKLKYKNDDILYVPTTNLDTIRKYVGGEETPKIYKLGGKDWSNTKARVKSNLKEVAKELIELYAKRQKVKGFAFSKDNEWQKQFENSFEYVETDDQLRCIEEVKQDMESDKPMDRLLCRRCWLW